MEINVEFHLFAQFHRQVDGDGDACIAIRFLTFPSPGYRSFSHTELGDPA